MRLIVPAPGPTMTLEAIDGDKVQFKIEGYEDWATVDLALSDILEVGKFLKNWADKQMGVNT